MPRLYTRTLTWALDHRILSCIIGGLAFFARAITPPGRTRRFDSRFFVPNAARVPNIDAPVATGTEELLSMGWFTIKEALSLDLPLITQDILQRLDPFLERNSLPGPETPVCFQYQRGKTWEIDQI